MLVGFRIIFYQPGFWGGVWHPKLYTAPVSHKHLDSRCSWDNHWSRSLILHLDEVVIFEEVLNKKVNKATLGCNVAIQEGTFRFITIPYKSCFPMQLSKMWKCGLKPIFTKQECSFLFGQMQERQLRETGRGNVREAVEVALWPRQTFALHEFWHLLTLWSFLLLMCF